MSDQQRRIGISPVEVINIAKARDGMVRVTLSDHADGSINLVTARENAPRIGDAYQVTFTPLAAT
jgi:hypothetical protein